jgi:hypothetical protein
MAPFGQGAGRRGQRPPTPVQARRTFLDGTKSPHVRFWIDPTRPLLAGSAAAGRPARQLITEAPVSSRTASIGPALQRHCLIPVPQAAAVQPAVRWTLCVPAYRRTAHLGWTLLLCRRPLECCRGTFTLHY